MKKIENRSEVVKYINENLQNFSGFVQFSHREFEANKDLFSGKAVKIDDEDGFISEAYFCDDEISVSIKMLDGSWYIDESLVKNIDKNDVQIYEGKFGTKIKLAQIWTEVDDENCLNLPVLMLKNVVFAGFKGDENETE